MVVVQEKASQWPEQSYCREEEEEGQSSNDNNEEAEEEDRRRHFSDLSRTFSLFPEEEISSDLWHQQSVDSKLSTTHHMLQIPWQLTMMSKVEMP
jgi:hypothetical protein